MPASPPSHLTARPDIVLVTYNSERDLERQVAARALDPVARDVIVVDNGSNDRSVELANDAGFRTRRLHDNPGYAAAANAGVDMSDAGIVTIMNPDVVFESHDAVEQLLQHFADPRVGLVAPALRLPSGEIQDSARSVPSPRELVARRVTRSDLGRVDAGAPTEVDWVVGACMFIRREALDSVRGFDARYRFYFEDVDLCVRLWAAQWSVVYDPTVVLRHEHGAGSRQTLLGWAMRQHVRSAARFYRRYPRLLTAAGRRAARQRWRAGAAAAICRQPGTLAPTGPGE
jgi:N-acetylglucosaminyl-diphospho-decaprenol L-rhamnosyltransferase